MSVMFQYLRMGKETFFIQGIKSGSYPYSVILDRDKTATLEDAGILLTSAQMESLEQRVQLIPQTKVALVDKFFKVWCKTEAPQALAVKTWSYLLSSCKKIQYASGMVGIGLIVLILQKPPLYVIVGAYVGVVALACLFGWSLHKYHLAEKELAVWQSPGEDFAKKRKAALELPLPQIIQKKCHFHDGEGMLLGVEILSIFRRDFKEFATPLLARECKTPQEQHRWVSEFWQNAPLVVKFFEENPGLLEDKRWKDVQKFQEQFDLFVKVLEYLKTGYVADFSRRIEAPKQKYEAIQKAFAEKSLAHFKDKKTPALQSNLYAQRVSKILEEECLGPIYALHLKDKSKVENFGSLVYPQLRMFLEEANKGLLLDQPYMLDTDAFKDPTKFVPADLQNEVDALVSKFPQNVIDKAKAVASQPAYHDFIAAVFTT
ncbi:MAG TPA: hypothetical protein VHK67_07895 [Rhabdochlamydiaceae bacterium]|jgi:hypothetical protein|nr:hypothetical protein [Rhabdochlamydiaceae bacterium]